MTDMRRVVLRATGGRATWIDPYVRSTRLSVGKHRAWIADQYRHPHESKHTIGEVLELFDENNLEFVRGVPRVHPWRRGTPTIGIYFSCHRVAPRRITSGSRHVRS
jgi:hypothetical protein